MIIIMEFVPEILDDGSMKVTGQASFAVPQELTAVDKDGTKHRMVGYIPMSNVAYNQMVAEAPKHQVSEQAYLQAYTQMSMALGPATIAMAMVDKSCEKCGGLGIIDSGIITAVDNKKATRVCACVRHDRHTDYSDSGAGGAGGEAGTEGSACDDVPDPKDEG